MRSSMILSALVLSALSLSLIGCATSDTDETAAVQHDGAATLASTDPVPWDAANLSVNGMSCPKCAENISLIVTSMDGVSRADVDLELGGVLVRFDGSGTRPSPAQLAAAIRDAGFTPVTISEAR